MLQREHKFLNQSISELVSVQIQLDLGLCLFGCGLIKSQKTHSVRKFKNNHYVIPNLEKCIVLNAVC